MCNWSARGVVVRSSVSRALGPGFESRDWNVYHWRFDKQTVPKCLLYIQIHLTNDIKLLWGVEMARHPIIKELKVGL